MKWFLAFALAAFVAVFSRGADMYTAPAPAAAVEEPAPEPILNGIVVTRPNGTFLTVTMEGLAISVHFFNEKKAPAPPDKTNGVVRYKFPSRTPEQRVLILADDGQSLTHGRPLRPPYVFKAFITLTTGEGDPSPETYTVDYP
jgi:hypothetical protein